jgi:hypothetical protein
MQSRRYRVATLVLSIAALAFFSNRGQMAAEDPKGDKRREAALREGMLLLFSKAIEEGLKQSMEDSIRVLQLNDPIEKGIYLEVLCSDGDSQAAGASAVEHCTASIVLMRPANNAESQETLTESSGNLDVVLTKIRARNIKSETATAVIIEEVEGGGARVEQSSFVYDSKQGWKRVQRALFSRRRPAK